MSISNSVLETNVSSVFTSTTSPDGDLVAVMYFCNRSNDPVLVNVHIVPIGDTADQDNLIYVEKPIAPLDTYIVDLEKIMLGTGDSIQANANANSAVVVTVSTIGA